ncbi:thymidine kinase [Arthrobacter sp. NyZ413]|uniref:thymidine kinase n=1 Tax=Arthrobacter sp. NyZ413 TaxID=3144669 RepID=UPI002C9DF8CB|nr:thymidine kinase [Arthrobacter sp.]
MAELIFFSGTMDCGKSTLALQMDHNHKARGRGGVRFSRNDRAGASVISSRLGLQTDAVEVDDTTDFWDEVVRRRTKGLRVDYLICDEAQFYSPVQVDQLARVVDEMDVDVFAFGITSDFRTKLFPGSQRLVELADRVQVLQVEALCWCGRRATHNARTVDGIMVVEGEQVVVGDVAMDGTPSEEPVLETTAPVVGYETLCRRHYMRRVTAHGANLMASRDQLLPFDVDACLWRGTH